MVDGVDSVSYRLTWFVMDEHPILYPVIAAHLSLLIGAFSFVMPGMVDEREAPELLVGREAAKRIVPKVSAVCGVVALMGVAWGPLGNPLAVMGLGGGAGRRAAVVLGSSDMSGSRRRYSVGVVDG